MFEFIQKYGLFYLLGGWPETELGGFAGTLILAGVGLGVSFPLAILIGFARTSQNPIFFIPASIWVYTLRGIPLLMILFWAYFLIPELTGRAMTPFSTALAAIIIYESAFMAEIVRAGIMGLPAGQTEAARSIGLGYWQSMRYVVLPQALVNMIPSFVNQFVSTVKATSIVYIIGVSELTFVAQQVNAIEVTNPVRTFIVLAFFYFIPCWGLSVLSRKIERDIGARRKAANVPGKEIRI